MKYNVSVIIPVYNEEKNISHILDVVRRSFFINEVICINDGSTDGTLEILQNTEGITVINLKRNLGKAYAIVQGLLKAKSNIVLFLDADLLGMNETCLQMLIFPLHENKYDAAIGYPSSTLDKLFKPISGQRAYFRKDLLPFANVLKKKGYGFELYLNFIFKKKSVKTFMLPGVQHILKHQKYTLKAALLGYVIEIKELLSEILFQKDPFAYFANTYIYPFYLQKKVIRVLFVYDSLSPIGGGSQIAALTWMNNLLAMGIIVKIVCNRNAENFIKELNFENYIGLPYLNLKALFPHYYPTILLTSSVKNEIKRFAPDIIHLHEPTLFTYQVMRFAKKHNIPTVYSYQTEFSKQTVAKFPLSLLLNNNGLILRFFSSIQVNLCNRADAVISLTQHYQKMLTAKFHKQIFLVIPPIKQYFYQIKRHELAMFPKKLLAISRLINGKHMDVLVTMMQFLPKDYHLTIIGDGPDKGYLHTLVKKLHLEYAITFRNWVALKDLPDAFVDSDIYVNASDSETFGITYISALATRTPCIVYDYEITREVIPDKTAVFLRTFDPKIWADAILSLQKSPGEYQRLCEGIAASYDVIKQYEEGQSTKALFNLYNYMTKNKPV